MNKPVPGTPSTVFCGIDVRAGSLAVALIEPDRPLAQRQFANSSSGHSALIAWLGKRELALTTPRHGEWPFHICHIDHTDLDVELLCSATNCNLGRPWLSILSDAFSRRLL